MADLAKAVELDPKDSWNHHALGCAHLDARSLTDALLSFRKAVEADPDQEYSRARVWLARGALGEAAAATRELKKYLKDRKADRPREWTGRLLAHLAGDLGEADLLKAAEAEAPRRVERLGDAYFYAGWKRMVEGNREGAKEFFRKCVEVASPADLARVSAAAALARIEKEK
jgi:lipoprotein NlpI